MESLVVGAETKAEEKNQKDKKNGGLKGLVFDVSEAEEGVILTEAEIETAEALRVNRQKSVENIGMPDIEAGTKVKIVTQEDERDSVEPCQLDGCKKTKYGEAYKRMYGTRWIVPADAETLPVFPDEGVIREVIYENKGILSDIMRGMNWHPVSKGEFMRWVVKLGLEKDLMVARDGIVDQAEGIVSKALDADDVETAKFVLKTAGKKRGWNERTEDGLEGKNVYQFINVVSGDGRGELERMQEKDLIKYLEDQINGSR